MKDRTFLIVGLGNFGLSYDETRHNVGFSLIDRFAKKHQISFREKKKLESWVGKTLFEGNELYLVKPTTFMNLSGKAVKRCAHIYNIPSSNIMILVDDIDLPFSEIRIKPKGGAGTHNGLKSIEFFLNTQEYMRLRVGIGKNKRTSLEKYVLEKFSPKEMQLLDETLNRAVEVIEIFLKQGMEDAMKIANTKVKQTEEDDT